MKHLPTPRASRNKGKPQMPPRSKRASMAPGVLVCFIVLVLVREITLLPSNEEFLQQSGSLLNPRLDFPSHGGNETIIFVHVGKTGGETILWRVKISCQLRRSKFLKQRCFEYIADEERESFLSKATVGHLHCDKTRPRNAIHSATAFMFSIRNPVDRVVSWFQYMHPDNCSPNRPSGACVLKKENSSWFQDFYQSCFPDVNDFAQSMGMNVMRGAFNCSDFALETVGGRGPEGPSNHMHFNYLYYANQTISRFPKMRIFVVRQENLWDDLRSIEKYLGGDKNRRFEVQGPTITHGSQGFKYRASLDPTFAPYVCCAMPEEIRTYKHLLIEASNLDIKQKTLTLRKLLQTCRIESFSKLSRKCGWNETQ